MSETDKNRQWLRYFRLVVAVDKDNQQAIDLSEFRCKFRISQAVIGKPCTAEITVYNVSQETVNRLGIGTNVIENQGMRVIIEAGYQNHHGIIFQGVLWWKSVGRESETETFMRLVAATGDRARQYAVVNVSVAKGASQREIFDRVVAAMKEKGVDSKQLPKIQFMDSRLPRGKVMFRMATDAMNGIADTNNFDWGYGVDGLVAIPKTPTYDPNEKVIVLNADTGLIGRPTLDEDGLDVQALLNPNLEIGAKIQIDNASVQRNNYDTTVSEDAVTKNQAVTDAFLSADGVYQVISREHVGDTRGEDWYTNLIVVGVNSASRPIAPSVFTYTSN